MSENIPIIPEHQLGNIDVPDLNYDEINNQILLLSGQMNFPNDIYKEDGIIKIPSTSKIHTLTVKYEQNNPLQVYVECEPISLSIKEKINDDDFLHGEWRFLVTRELDFIELSNKDYTQESQRVRVADNFMENEILNMTHTEFFADGEWHDGDLYIDLKGKQTLEGFVYEGMGMIFVYDSNFYSELPTPTIHGEEPDITNTYFMIQDQDALSTLSEYLLETSSIKDEDGLDKWENISITFDSFHDGYSLNSTGSPYIDNILEIKNNVAGEIIYLEDGFMEETHVE